ncbi:MAG: D-aminoacyl-tRNA deacylase [Bacillota bacterium]
MRAVVQRVKMARVSVADRVTGEIGGGLLVFVAVGRGDTPRDAAYVAEKVTGLRVFPDAEGRMNLSVKDLGLGVLAVSQFTLYGDVRKGRRPSFTQSEDPERAKALFYRFVDFINEQGVPVQTGEFQAMMEVQLINDGPVTILIDSEKTF